METYKEWEDAFYAKGGGYSQIVKGYLANESLMKLPVYFEIKKEKRES